MASCPTPRVVVTAGAPRQGEYLWPRASSSALPSAHTGALLVVSYVLHGLKIAQLLTLQHQRLCLHPLKALSYCRQSGRGSIDSKRRTNQGLQEALFAG